MYKLNSEGQIRYKYVSKEFIKGIIIEPLVYSFITLLVYFSVGSKSLLYFYLIFGYILIWYMISLYATVRMVIRQNRTISEVDFLNDNVVIKTDKILWLKAKEYMLNNSKAYYKNRKFRWYGKKTEKEGLSIFFNDMELFLVKDYFDDYVDIVNLL